MREETAKAAFERRETTSDATKDAMTEFTEASDHYTTCQKCGHSCGVVQVDGAWLLSPHDCNGD